MRASVSSCLFIRLIVNSLKQLSAVSWGVSLHAPPLPPSVFVCCAQWSVYQSIHLPPVPTLIHQPTLHCLISLSANLPSCICLTFPLSGLSWQSVSQSVSQSVQQEQQRLKCIKMLQERHFCHLCFLLSPLTSNRSRPLTFNLWQMSMSHCARWWRWR